MNAHFIVRIIAQLIVFYLFIFMRNFQKKKTKTLTKCGILSWNKFHKSCDFLIRVSNEQYLYTPKLFTSSLKNLPFFHIKYLCKSLLKMIGIKINFFSNDYYL